MNMKKQHVMIMLLTVCMQMAACEVVESKSDFTDAPQKIQTSEFTTVQESTDFQVDGSAISQFTIDKNTCISEINDLREKGLKGTSLDNSYEWPKGDRDFFSEAQTKYLQLLDIFSDNYEQFEIFGGAYFQNGYLNVLITDIKNTDILDSIDKENVIVRECRFSYSYLVHIEDFIKTVSAEGGDVNSGSVLILKNSVFVTVSNDTVKSEIYEAIEAKGLDTEAAEIIVSDSVVANPA